MTNQTSGGVSAIASNLKSRFLVLIQSFRASSRYFKWRTAVLGGWLLLATLSVILGLVGGERNPLEAAVEVRTVLGDHVILVENNSAVAWQEVVIVLPGGWQQEHRTIRPGERVVAQVQEFSKGGDPGQQFAPDFSPSSVGIHTRSGSYVFKAR